MQSPELGGGHAAARVGKADTAKRGYSTGERQKGRAVLVRGP